MIHMLDRWAYAVRSHPRLRGAHWLWNRLRPGYVALLGRLSPRGLPRSFNGSDTIRMLARHRRYGGPYEPEVWRHLMARVRLGDVVADVGAYVGIYTVALARRVGPGGRVVAFEPTPASFADLTAHVRLNGVAERVDLVHAAVAEETGQVWFNSGKDVQSHISAAGAPGTDLVPAVRLDDFFAGRRVDIMKVDTEGYEEAVLRGSQNLLADPARRPRILYIEVHPYAWPAAGTSCESLLGLLQEYDYQVTTLEGQPVTTLTGYGEIIARTQEFARGELAHNGAAVAK